ncbi:MAG: helix-turn-helix domain-containing protein [Syntrophales bacterium]|nr:helix-turn-helix domain-containing protein [Syntrophales bacterium]MDD4338159.1 helix-turn-helix domain-containing protein [Syntrophales bacterium]HOG07186.1 helix-turn-helix domain-containing protein [Syntrophales bacterium]HOS76511.1 helix-turn-helix domain-containing protein [Syntrophales bacterium]HPB69325.1 helix-turn-helix domain-containing protein [Syntrophales bacterium]
MEEADDKSGSGILDLKALRESRGLTLENVHQRTRISMTNLEALEAFRFEALPIPIYTRGFLRLYAQAVGIDPAPLLEHHRQYLNAISTTAPTEVPAGRPLKRLPGKTVKRLLWSAALIVLVGVLFIALTAEQRTPGLAGKTVERSADLSPDAGSDAPAPGMQKDPQEAGMINPVMPENRVSTPTAPADPKPPAAAVTGQAVPPDDPARIVKGQAPPYRLALEARELTWIRITQDQEQPYQILLNPGDRVERVALQGFTLDIGNASGVAVVFQGRSLGELGDPGEVVHLRLPAAP